MTLRSVGRHDTARALETPRQDFGITPTAVRESGHYQAEYIQSFVEKWDELIDWGARADSEGLFFIELLKARDKVKVLDVATGTGFHSVQLLDAGFEFRDADPDAPFCDVWFDDMERDAQSELGRIYQWLGVKLDAATRALFADWLSENRRDRRPRVRPQGRDDRGVLGLRPSDLRLG